jgi:hypothetical protein
LLRKGGIREENKRFEVAHRQVLLYPTYEHQKPHLLKPEYGDRVTPVTSGWHPDSVKIGSWAQITDIFKVSQAETIAALSEYHIWTENFARDRFHWKPQQPLYLLLLRVYHLREVVNLPYRQAYGGCRSWIEIETPISLDSSTSVLSDRDYHNRVQTLSALASREQSLLP